MHDEIIVKQETGQDSIVTVKKKDTVDFMQHPVSTLFFISDQYLDTQSGRAWECNKAIERYCIERGYQVARRPTGRNTTQAVYDKNLHSSVEVSRILKQVQSDQRFVQTVEQAQAQAVIINKKYAPIIARIKHLAFLLGEAQDVELDVPLDAIKAMQSQIVSEIDMPDEVSVWDREHRLLEPCHTIVRIERLRMHSKNLPDLEQVAALMSELDDL